MDALSPSPNLERAFLGVLFLGGRDVDALKPQALIENWGWMEYFLALPKTLPTFLHQAP